jgi:hypothetical protein
VKLRLAVLGVGAVFMTAATAHADETKAGVVLGGSQEAPWFQRFTSSSTIVDPGKAADQVSDKAITWSMPSNKWGLTLNIRDADRTKASGRDEQTVGAFYHFTPRLRVGGEVSLADSPLAASGPTKDEEKSAGVKLESAFKF